MKKRKIRGPKWPHGDLSVLWRSRKEILKPRTPTPGKESLEKSTNIGSLVLRKGDPGSQTLVESLRSRDWGSGPDDFFTTHLDPTETKFQSTLGDGTRLWTQIECLPGTRVGGPTPGTDR